MGRRILISAGPMRTAIDPVRFVQNRSSGKMGLALALEAQRRGNSPHVLLGPVDSAIRQSFQGMEVTDFERSGEYSEKLSRLFKDCDWFLSAAAVLDFEIFPSELKLERDRLGESLSFPMRTVPDFVQRCVLEKSHKQRVIAFAAETGTETEILARAAKKLKKKGADALILNPVSPKTGPDVDSNRVWILSPSAAPIDLGQGKKTELAKVIWDTLEQTL